MLFYEHCCISRAFIAEEEIRGNNFPIFEKQVQSLMEWISAQNCYLQQTIVGIIFAEVK